MPLTPAPLDCPCHGAHFATAFSYTAPPEGEVRFRFTASGEYRREILRCQACGHFVSRHGMDASGLYTGDYVSSTYGDDGIREAFERILALDPSKSDNAGRVRAVLEFAAGRLGQPRAGQPPSVLDVGSGLCVFLHRMRAAGWECTALDPDPRAVRHARETVGVAAVCGDFLSVPGLGRYDLVTFNKVLEHVRDPVAMLKRAGGHLTDRGFVYVELPDGEAATADGPGREEFFIDHWHIFSPASTALLAARAGFSLRRLERLREPSGKYTIRAYLTSGAVGPGGSSL